MKKISYDILINLASEIANIEKEEKAKLPHKANIIDNIHICENAHSRILTTLLNYAGHDHSFPIYQTFIDLLKKKCGSVRNIIIHNPNITAEKERIDILIDESPTYSIIIENKVCWAVDQPKQIENYIKKIQNHNVSQENIFVVYLTENDDKKVSNLSLTTRAKKLLNYGDEKLCRFIELNYKDDLLPMFTSLTKQIDRDKESLLHSSLVQYADYWKGRFLMRDGEQEIKQTITKYMADKLKINNAQECFKISDELQKLQFALNEKKEELMKQVLKEKVMEPIKKYLGKKYEYELPKENRFRIIPSTWNHAYIGIEYDDYSFIIGVYGDQLSDIVVRSLESKEYERDKKGYNKYVIDEAFCSTRFWNLVDNGVLLKELKKDIKEIANLLEGRRL